MGQVIQFPQKGKLPSQEADFEQKLRKHTEGKGALSFGDTEHVADASTGEQLEVDPVRFNSVYAIYEVLKRNFAKKDEAGRQSALAELQKEMGVVVDTNLSPATTIAETAVPEEVDPSKALEHYLHTFAERIYEALENCRESIAAVKPESINGKTVSRLGEKGDANFVVATGKGEKLYGELQSRELGFRTVEKNDYGFSIENDELDFKVTFIYQERLHEDGSPKKLEELKDAETPDEDAIQDQTLSVNAQQANNQSNLGNGGSLAA